MANPVATYTPENSLRDADVRTKSVLLAATLAVLPALTPLKRDPVTYQCIPATDIGDKIVGLTVPLEPGSGYTGLIGIPASAEAQWVSVYTECTVSAEAVNFDNFAPGLSRSEKDAIFDSTEILLQFDELGF